MFWEVVLFLILFIVIYTFWNQDPSDYPPGPFKFPIIGGGRPINDERCFKLQKKYGDLIMDKIGKCHWLTICDYKLAKEALSKSEVANRPELEFFKELTGTKIQGIASTNGEHWKTNRRFVIQYLKDSGMGKSFLEESIQREAAEIVAEFNQLSGGTTNLTFLNFASLNVIWQMVASMRFDVNDPKLDEIQRMNREFTKTLSPLLVFEFIPILKKIIPSFVAKYILKPQKFVDFFDAMKNISQPIIEEHKKKLDRNNPKDLIDAYCLEEENSVKLKKEFISESDLRSITIDLLNAGSETVSLSLRWTIFYLTKYPKIQTKLQEEIDNVVPRDILPGYQYKKQLPFCEAVIHEMLRHSSLAPFGGFRTNFEEFYLGGYRIPKDTIITNANNFIHHDPRYWNNPNVFNPERFLDENGKFCCPKEGFLPFGIGKRQCPGESLARSELYIFITSIFQNFSFSAPEGKDIDISFAYTGVGLHLPIDQLVCVHSRQQISKMTNF